MPDTTLTPATVVTTPAAPAAATEPTLDQQLEALGETPVAPGATPAPAANAAPPVPSTEGAATDPLAALEAITEETIPATPAKAALTPEQERVFSIIPTAAEAERVAGLASSYSNFTGAFERGDFPAVEQMFQAWKPDTYAQFLDHIYQQKVASGEWVDRWIQEKEVPSPVSRLLTPLQRQVTDLQNQLKARTTQEQTGQQEQARQKVTADYLAHVNGLFDQIKFSAADRRWVTADLNNRVMQDARVKAALNAGNMPAVNGLFKAAVREYVDRDKLTSAAQAAVLAGQEGKKAPLQTAPVTDSLLPDDIKQVPKGQEENWMDQALGKLGKLVGRR